MKVDRHG